MKRILITIGCMILAVFSYEMVRDCGCKPVDDKPVRLLRIRQRQQILKQAGYYSGEIDDIRGPETISAEDRYFCDMYAVEDMHSSSERGCDYTSPNFNF